MASAVSNGNDRSEKWHRPFQMATTVYEREICGGDGGKPGSYPLNKAPHCYDKTAQGGNAGSTEKGGGGGTTGIYNS